MSVRGIVKIAFAVVNGDAPAVLGHHCLRELNGWVVHVAVTFESSVGGSETEAGAETARERERGREREGEGGGECECVWVSGWGCT